MICECVTFALVDRHLALQVDRHHVPEASDLPDQFPHELGRLGQLPLGAILLLKQEYLLRSRAQVQISQMTAWK